MASKSIRLQMLPQTEQHLEEMARRYKCFYGDKPSISTLLAKIASGELEIEPSSTLKKQDAGKLIEIKLITFLNLKGITYIVSKKISELQGNIFKVNVDPKDHLGVLTFVIKIEEKKILRLIKNIQNIKIEDIQTFNKEDKEQHPEDILYAVENTFDFSYTDLKSKIKDESITEQQSIFWNRIKSERLIRSISYTVGIRVITKNESGFLAKVSEKIAKAKILISIIKLDFDHTLEQAVIDIFLESKININVSIDDITGLDKIEKVINEINEITGVKKVNRLGEEFLDK